MYEITLNVYKTIIIHLFTKELSSKVLPFNSFFVFLQHKNELGNENYK